MKHGGDNAHNHNISKILSVLKRRSWSILFLLSLGMMVLAQSASAQQPTPTDDEVNAIARQLYCPVCENTPLEVCPTQACHQWRELIRQMLAEGKSEAEIKQYFVDNYGARVLSTPPAEGLNWLIYVVPPVLFVAGAYLLFRSFRLWRRVEKVPAGIQPDIVGPVRADDEYVSRLEEELRKRK